MASEPEIPSFVLRTLMEGATDPLVALSLEAMTRRPEGFLLIELAEALSQDELDEAALRPCFTASEFVGGWQPTLSALHASLRRSLDQGVMTKRALQGWASATEIFRGLAAEFAQARVDSQVVREVLVQAAGRDLPHLEVGPRPIGRFVHPGPYNWAMMRADRFGDDLPSRTLLSLPFFKREETRGQGRLDGALTFPVTGAASLEWLLKGFCNPWRPPCVQIAGLEAYDVNGAMRVCGFDPRLEKTEPGWHAVAMPKASALGEAWFHLFGGPYEEQCAKVEELYPGWRIASVAEILTWAILHRRLFDTWPVQDLILRARRRGPVSDDLAKLNWVVHFDDMDSGPRIWVMNEEEAATNLGVALSRVPETTSS